jgi:hypothetical protein
MHRTHESRPRSDYTRGHARHKTREIKTAAASLVSSHRSAIPTPNADLIRLEIYFFFIGVEELYDNGGLANMELHAAGKFHGGDACTYFSCISIRSLSTTHPVYCASEYRRPFDPHLGKMRSNAATFAAE